MCDNTVEKQQDEDWSAKLPPNKEAVNVNAIHGKSRGYVLARCEQDPATRHAVLGGNASASVFQGLSEQPGIGDRVDSLADLSKQIGGGDLKPLGQMLAAQALSLDALFTKMASLSLANVAQFPDTARNFMQLALKAQANSRATMEALVKMHQPREQTVNHNHRHYYIGADGKAVFIENHGGKGNAQFDTQSHAAAAIGARAALPGANPLGLVVPVPGDAERPMQDARGNESGRSQGQS